MSFIITLTTQEGIVMASDSRLSINNSRNVAGTPIVDSCVSQTDTSYKTFLAANAIGISTFGTADVGGVPLSGYIEAFIREKVDANTSVEKVPGLLLEYAKTLPSIPATGFHVAGYSKGPEGKKTPFVSRVFLINGAIFNVVPTQQLLGAMWDGESDVMVRILNPNLFIRQTDGRFDPLVNYNVPFDMFTLQDAIDYAVYAVRVTSDTMKFQLRYKTVGGPVDVLVIKPDGANWLSRKMLRIDAR